MLQFSRIPKAMYSSSQHFQLVYFCRFATFSKARQTVIYSVSGAQPPPQFEKHGQRSEHTGFLTVHRLFCFASCLHYEIAGGVGGGRSPPPICKTWTRIRTHISSCTPLMDVCSSVFCDVFDLRDNCYLQYAYSSKRRKYSNLKYSFVPF